MRRFEYLTFSFPPQPPFPAILPHEDLMTLNDWGEKGWEVVSVLTVAATLGASREIVVVLKRELAHD